MLLAVLGLDAVLVVLVEEAVKACAVQYDVFGVDDPKAPCVLASFRSAAREVWIGGEAFGQ